jgi:hypothetical protein
LLDSIQLRRRDGIVDVEITVAPELIDLYRGEHSVLLPDLMVNLLRRQVCEKRAK